VGKVIYAEAFSESERAIPRLADLDSNRLPYAERLLDHMALYPSLDDDDNEAVFVAAAIRAAEANLATAREAAEHISELRAGPAYCYLAFHGLDDVAQFVKVGMTRHPERRLYEMATGNPLDCLWVFTCRVPCVRMAYRIEQSLLRHLEAHKRRGEWITLGSIDAEAAASLAMSMGDLAKSIEPEAEGFTLLGYTDGR